MNERVHTNLQWTCPFCDRDTVITQNLNSIYTHEFTNNGDNYKIKLTVITCPNKECGKFELTSSLYKKRGEPRPGLDGTAITYRYIEEQNWSLIPASKAKPLPDYVPKPIIDDYYEACLIRDLSPKASATLSRRCLQGMIRDFWGVSKDTLFKEIDAIKEKVDPIEWNTIDAVRKIGNIGAHMEKNINLIIDVDQDEAQLLITLIESLIGDWYVTRHNNPDFPDGRPIFRELMSEL